MGTLTKDKGPRKLDHNAQYAYKEQSTMQAISAKDRVTQAEANKQAKLTMPKTQVDDSGPNWRKGNFKAGE